MAATVGVTMAALASVVELVTAVVGRVELAVAAMTVGLVARPSLQSASVAEPAEVAVEVMTEWRVEGIGEA
jgi:hypothetical protein